MKLVIKKKVTAAPRYQFLPLTQGLSQSQVGTLMECQEKARLNTVLGWTPKGSSKPLIWGTTFHGMLEAGYKSLRKTRTWPEQSALIMNSEKELAGEYPNPTSTVKDIIEECFLETTPIIGPYRQKWAAQDDKVKWVHVEDAFKVQIVPGLPPVKGKYDAVFEHPRFGLSLLETKTKSQISHNLTEYLPLDLQLAWYLVSLEKERIIPNTVWYNIIRRPGLKRGKEETALLFQERIAADLKTRPDHYFVRVPVTLEKKEMEFAKDRVKYLLEWYMEWSKRTDSNKRCLGFNSGACEGKYGTCSYLPICANQDYSGHYIREHVSPELKELK
jgi:hypothetical protein